MKLYEYAVLWHPTEKQKKDEGRKSCILVNPTYILQSDQNKAAMAAASKIPAEYLDQLEQVEVAVRPF